MILALVPRTKTNVVRFRFNLPVDTNVRSGASQVVIEGAINGPKAWLLVPRSHNSFWVGCAGSRGSCDPTTVAASAVHTIGL